MRHGKLKFSAYTMLDLDVMKEIQKQIILVATDSDYVSSTVTYYGVSDLFDDVDPTDIVPWYKLEFKRINKGILIVDAIRVENDVVKDWLK